MSFPFLVICCFFSIHSLASLYRTTTSRVVTTIITVLLCFEYTFIEVQLLLLLLTSPPHSSHVRQLIASRSICSCTCYIQAFVFFIKENTRTPVYTYSVEENSNFVITLFFSFLRKPSHLSGLIMNLCRRNSRLTAPPPPSSPEVNGNAV